jgi:hypothetical protein
MASGNFATIADEPADWTTYDELEALKRAGEKEKKAKEKAATAAETATAAVEEMYRAAHWFCHPRCGFKVDRRDEGAIQQHQLRCGWQIELRKRRAADKQAYKEGIQRMRYILHAILQADADIERL